MEEFQTEEMIRQLTRLADSFETIAEAVQRLSLK
jgi:hypothetical protein